jgi:hypothetical protein
MQQLNKIGGYIPLLCQCLIGMFSSNKKAKGIKVTFGKTSTGWASRNEVCITNSVLNMKDQVKAKAIALCLVVHEGLGHIIHTNFDEWETFVKAHPEMSRLLNVIEDPRIEKTSWAFLPGIRCILQDGCKALLGDGLLKMPADPSEISAGDTLCSGLLHVLRGEFLEQDMDAAGGRRLLAEKFGQDLSDQIIELAFEGCVAKSTAEAGEKVLAIFALLKEESEKQPESEDPQPQDQSDPEDGESQPQDGQGQEDEGESDPSEQGSGSGKGKPDPAQSDETQSDEAGSGQPEPSAKPKPTPEQQQKQYSKNAADALNEMKSDQVQETDLGQVIQKVADSAPQQKGSGSSPIFGPIDTVEPTGIERTLSNDILGAAVRMAARLEQVMASLVNDDDQDSYSGEINGNLLSKVKLLDLQVFHYEQEDRQGIDSAVLHLLDASGSMDDVIDGKLTKADLCFNTAWAASTAMAKFQSEGVEMGIWSYGGVLTKFVDFGAWNHQKNRFRKYDNDGGTATFPAVVEGVSALLCKRQKRKHLIVYSDGDLGGLVTENYLLEAIKMGIEVSIIYIGHQNTKKAAVSKLLEKHVYIVHDTNSIVNTMFNCLKPR